MRNQSYYEAILQLRPGKKKLLDFVENKIKKKENVSVVKVEELKEGIDVFLDSWRFAISLGKMLKKSFGGSVKVTRKLHTQSRQTGKRIYKVTVLFRL